MKNIHLFCSIVMVCLLPSLVNATDKMTLRLALLPIPDTLPVYIAEDAGLFAQAGLKVEVVRVGSGMERDQLMQAGQVDGMLNELISTASFNRHESQVQVVAIARKPMGEEPLFRLLAGPKSGITALSELEDKSIVISKNTIIDYISERMLGEAGLDNVKTRSVPSLPERYQLLLSGQVEVATLPEPLASSAIAAGAIELMNDTEIADQSVSVLSFSTSALKEKERAVALFVDCWMKAAEMANNNPEEMHPVMLKKIRVPKNVKTSYHVPTYPIAQLPSRELWKDSVQWMIGRGVLSSDITYESSVYTGFVEAYFTEEI